MQGFNNNSLVGLKSWRSGKSWKEICDEVTTECNQNLHPLRILSISTVLCHTDGNGLVTVYYDDSQNAQFNSNSGFHLKYAEVRTKKSWATHSADVKVLLNQLGSNGVKVVSVNDLEINKGHEECFTVIWYLTK